MGWRRGGNMNKTFYIFSFWNSDDLEYDWFIGTDHSDYDKQEQEVINYLKNSFYDDEELDIIREKIEGIYKQDRGILLRQLLDI
jgi:hypothetical protein